MLPPKSHHGALNSPKKTSPSSPPSPRPSKIASFRRRFAAKPPPDPSISPDRSSALMRIVSPCWKPPADDSAAAASSSHAAPPGRAEGLLWYKDLGRHAAGDFSMATAQANNLMEDASQIESGPIAASDGAAGSFVGVYDGHGGPETSRYVADNLFRNIRKFAAEHQGMSPDVIRKAYAATEEGFISVVRRQWIVQPQLASVGSCCLIGVVFGGMLYIANVGDSRAVLGRLERGEREVTAVQMSAEHNASIESVRDELRELHPDDPQIVVMKHKVWRVKGLIQISRSIGDAYLKDSEFNREPLLARFRLPQPFTKSILSAEPSIVTHKLCPKDQFLICASDGLWEHLTNQEAADIVHDSPRNGVARRLVKAALKQAARKREMRYSDLKKIERGVRRHFHDDISVIVLFLDFNLINKNFYNNNPVLSLRGGGVPIQPDPLAPRF